jgi:hypothetical protein
MKLPCGKCNECKTKKAQEWALRGKHEAKQWPHNAFITLTYNDDHLPAHESLEPHQLTRFIKRLRNRATRHPEDILGERAHGVRTIHCGEYGGTTERPHYHLLAFNCGFRDAQKNGHNNGNDYYRSQILDELWSDERGPIGHANFGMITAGAAAAYMAKYTMKNKHRRDRFNEDGEVTKLKEFMRMSTRPMIGQNWVDKWAKTDARHGTIWDDGHHVPIPRSYRRAIQKHYPELYEEIEHNIERSRLQNPVSSMDCHRNHPDRMAARAVILAQKIKMAEDRRTLR